MGSGPAPRSCGPGEQQPTSEAPTPNQLPPRAAASSSSAAAAAFSLAYSLEKDPTGCKSNQTSRSDFAKSLTKISLSRPRPLLPRPAGPAGTTKCSLLPGRSCTQGRAGWGCFVLVLSPLAQGKDLGHLKWPNAGHFPARRCHFFYTKIAPREEQNEM